jgi:ATP-dependent DNA helicase RecQ
MHYDSRRALELLKLGTGRLDARFREGQEEAIRHLVEGRRRQLLVQRTGWGKSFVYFIATQLLREAGLGPTLLVSPLLALMRNQIAAAERMGVRANTINSDNHEDWDSVEEAIRADTVDIVLISPERLANERFRNEVLAEVAQHIALLVIDEAHCISDWGHDFRPHYRLIERIVRILPPNLRLLSTTATANARVMADLEVILGPGLQVLRGDLSRPSLALQTIRMGGQAERLAWLAQWLPSLPGSGIVYTLTVRDAHSVADWLRSRGIEVAAYTSRTGPDRVALEQALLDDNVKALVATTALGMGFDKPDLAFVIHYQAPGSVVAYYQQVGRAGRALEAARGVLLSGEEDTEITGYFIRSAFPTRNEVEQVLAALEADDDGSTQDEIEKKVNVSSSRIQKTLQLLSLEAPPPIVRQGSSWQLTAASLSDDFWERAERLTDLRRKEQAEMQEYVRLSSGHMAFLIGALDGDPGGISSPPLPPLPAFCRPEIVSEAVAFLRRSNLPVEPRQRWPPGGMIDGEHRAQEGRVLCVWNDAGWGRPVSRGKLQDGRFSNELVDACVELLRKWRPDPPPTWVAAIPSLRNPYLVPDFACRLAAALNLPFSRVLQKKGTRPEQKTMENSDRQARNVIRSLAVDKGAILPGPVLLVDDVVDSRWTFTVAAWELRRRGCGPVWPIALADAGGRL